MKVVRSSAAAGSVVAARSSVITGLRLPSRSQVRTNKATRPSPTRSLPAPRIRGSSRSGSNGQSIAAAQQIRLAAEEVGDQRRVDAGLRPDRPHRCPLEAPLGEQALGGGHDRLARSGSRRWDGG
jgi:hypothetical protein